MARKKNWKEYLQQQRRIERYTAGIEAVAVEARLRVQAHLPPQRLRFLEGVAQEHKVSLVGVGV
jgi:hypothetical protein